MTPIPHSVHNFRDKDIEEIFVITEPKNTLLHISYLGPTEETFYTREDIEDVGYY